MSKWYYVSLFFVIGNYKCIIRYRHNVKKNLHPKNKTLLQMAFAMDEYTKKAKKG
jgi:hypothetical protein